MKYFHSHVIVPERCTGRMRCIKACPTMAIRIRHNKIVYFDDLCVDCGACINVCQEDVFVPVIDEISDFEKFELKIAMPSRILYTQFGLNIHPDIIHQALKNIGFDMVVDTSRETHDMSYVISTHLKAHPEGKPIISSFCPSIIRYIQVRYPDLMELISTFDVPREIAAKTAKKKYSEKLGIPVNKIGVIYITPCPAMVVSIKQPAEKEKSWIDGAIAIKDIYNVILPEILNIQSYKKLEEPDEYFFYGRGWGGMSRAQQHLDAERCMLVRGIDNVKMILDDIEDSKLRNVDYIEAFICSQGCISGAFCVENPYISRHNSILLEKRYGKPADFDRHEVIEKYKNGYYFMEHPIFPRNTRTLTTDIAISIKRMKQKERILTKLPKKDCGLCGAPGCEAFAEDCSRGEADLTDCIFFKRTSL
jgi:iron only hydrogenase large subunit-like protein